MVDINLFDDETDEPKKEDNEDESWDTLPDEGGELEESDLDDDLLFGEGASEPTTLDEGALLDEEETVPDFEEMDEPVSDDDYDVGDNGKKTNPIAWILLGCCLIALVFWFVIKPMFLQPKGSPIQTTIRKPKPVVQKPTSSDQQPGLKTTTVPLDTKKVQIPSDIQAGISTVISESMVNFIDVSKSVFNDLTHQRQLGTIMIDQDRFMILFRSTSPGMSQAIGSRIKNLIGASDFKISPEDKMRSGSQVYYSAVVSGELPSKAKGGFTEGSGQFADDEKFIQGIQGVIQNNGLVQKTFQKTSTQTVQGIQKSKFRLTIEGEREKTINFLEAIKTLKGSWGIDKILIAPVENLDTTAQQAKLELICWAGVM